MDINRIVRAIPLAIELMFLLGLVVIVLVFVTGHETSPEFIIRLWHDGTLLSWYMVLYVTALFVIMCNMLMRPAHTCWPWAIPFLPWAAFIQWDNSAPTPIILVGMLVYLAIVIYLAQPKE